MYRISPRSGCPLVGLHGGWGVGVVFSLHFMASSTSSTSHGAKRTMSDSEESQPAKHSKTDDLQTDDFPTDESSSNPNENWPRFLVLTSLDATRPLTNISPWVFKLALKGLAGSPKDVQKLRSGDYLVEVTKRSHSENLLRSTSIINIPMKVSPHKILNYSRGVIRSRDIFMCEESEILEGLAEEGVIKVDCITRRTQAGVERSGTYFLTFNTPELPEYVHAGYHRIQVNPYIPNPLRCFHCQKLGHNQSKCKNQKVCAKCSGQGHSYEECSLPPKCANCPGHHPSSDKKCPKWITEKKIQEYKVLNKCSFPEARKALEHLTTPTSNTTFSDMVKRTINSATQTNVGIQVSGEEIDAAISVAPPSQTCRHCHHLLLEPIPAQTMPSSQVQITTQNRFSSLPIEEIEPAPSSTESSNVPQTSKSFSQKKPTIAPKPNLKNFQKSNTHEMKKGKNNNLIPQTQASAQNVQESQESSQTFSMVNTKNQKQVASKENTPQIENVQETSLSDSEEVMDFTHTSESQEMNGNTGEVVTDHPQADISSSASPGNTDRPLNENWEGFGQCVVDDSNLPPKPVPPDPPDNTNVKKPFKIDRKSTLK